jgi:hypothetical protein
VSIPKADTATKEALRYRTALLSGYQDLKQSALTTNAAIAICRAIKNVDLGIRQTPGTVLRNQNTGRHLRRRKA